MVGIGGGDGDSVHVLVLEHVGHLLVGGHVVLVLDLLAQLRLEVAHGHELGIGAPGVGGEVVGPVDPGTDDGNAQLVHRNLPSPGRAQASRLPRADG